ncbi:uncharacterized protein LOC122859596 isoform X1 [Aphidius gifuensis]|uniref:uncharacterized protein LOC122859596 isoform X1 n=1 Tax=Aphidius gifuensis TaxID=684658 RepID=UPI001CDC701D|nr:uncharacterized protein LOC122859596 isoform X1 [Aphidius gifuensis]
MCRKVLTPVTTPSNTLSTPTDTIFEFDITKYQISFDEKINQLTSKLDSKITSIRKEFNETAKSIKSVCVELNTDLGKIVAAHNVAIKSLQNSMAENKNAIDILNANIENNNNICIQQSVKEIEDRLARKRNFIILNIPESKSPSELVKKSDDIKEFTNLIKSTDSAELVEIAGNVNLIRIGKISNPAKPRPIKVICKNSTDCEFILQSLWSFKKKPETLSILQTIYFSKDKTKLQQEDFKKVKEDLMNRMKNGEKNLGVREPWTNFV